jgi:outer membrane receptor protein involved in Fe transport
VQVGQNVSLNLTLEPLVPAAETAAAAADTVVVSSIRDTRTSEVGTNITQKQINTLPQGTRNFLAFADLVPGVAFETLGDGSTRLRGGAMSAAGINVYIDGVGQKNYVLQGGITGQDSSRGNVFPQSAIAEYKVITQNYKAEYDQVSSVGIAAVTRSGTNTFRGEAFWDHSTAAWRAPTPAERRAGRKSPSNDDQFGLAMGGAIVPDRAHWFFAYEGKNIDSPKTVTLGQGRSEAELPAALRGLAGPVGAPFTEHLLFAKLDASLDDYNLFELAFKLRRETETTGVGGTESLPYGTYKKNDETRFDLRWQRSAPTWVNDARVTYEDAGFSPRARTLAPGYLLTTADPGQVILRGGGGRDFQNKGQKGPALQNDFTFTGLEWAGSHVIKLGAKLKWVTVDAQEQNPFNPQFFYDIGQNTGQPYKVQFGAPLAGIGDGRARSRNTQVGLYVQDDWEVNNNFTLNLGLRWDYERSPGYLDYVTPPAVVAALRSAGGVNAHGSGVNIEDFIATGNSRRTFTRAWQPRAGLSFDLNADQRHVIYGGYARAYDRNLFDYLQLERTKETFSQYEFQFDTAAHPCAGDTCLAWNPAYLDPAVLVALANGQGTGRELDLLSNKLKTPHSDQFSVGMRNSIGDWNTEVALSRVQSKDGLVFLLGNRRPDGSFFVPGASWNPPYGSPVPGFGSLLLGTNGLATRSHSLLLKADKPYDPASGWAAGVAYTYTNAKENRQFGEHYALDYPNLEAYGWKQAGGVSRHRLVATGIVDGPRDSVFSVRLTLATHAPRYGTNCLASPADNSGCFIDQLKPRGNRFLIGGPMWGYRQLDVAVSKAFRVPGGTLRLRADLINVLNAKNYDGYDTWWGTNNVPNANFGQPDGSLKGPTRTLKLGLAYAW